MRIQRNRPRPDQRPRRSKVDDQALTAARDRVWVEAFRYRITL